ncbi:MAG: hypothetical protein ACRC9V_08540 [Aeromonas sp.]
MRKALGCRFSSGFDGGFSCGFHCSFSCGFHCSFSCGQDAPHTLRLFISLIRGDPAYRTF